MNKLIHTVILALFGVVCWFVWVILPLTTHVGTGNNPLPAFTRLCLDLRPVLLVLPILAATYCIYVWVRKSDGRRSWVGFFAATMGTLVLVTLPAFVAAYLPLIDSINRLAKR